ncbi:hypothetical protein [Isoptericola sp. NPDC057191]|uniref:hypothetical protein n=1 Tax=Isoptericola sp. NPDC057191 TaxID=3346041 RepID=UPI003634E758
MQHTASLSKSGPVENRSAEITALVAGTIAVVAVALNPLIGALVALAAAALTARSLTKGIGRRPWVVTGLAMAGCAALVGICLSVLSLGTTEEVGLDLNGNNSVERFN